MSITRRSFMQGLAVFSGLGLAPKFLTDAYADPSQAIRGFNDDRVLVVVQLGGGNDGLNTIVPFEDDLYYNARPKLGLRQDRLLKLNDHLGMNDAMKALMPLYDNGNLAV
ncbi:MAG: twin-arginine translocation pathway signal protein, partial [Candidatus Hydrogenedentes bacterium]|nr:twin-arginine translocation pathway signal protein [Candidatus Hydrogenedentota bacterium]